MTTMTIKHVVRPCDVERDGRWVREWSVYALRAEGAVEVVPCVTSRAKARKLAHELNAPPAPRSFRPEFLVSGAWCSNAQRFATLEEALASAHARFLDDPERLPRGAQR